MKKLKITLTTCICLCFCFMCGMFLVACDNKEQPEEFNPYITITGLSTACEVGGELDYSNAKILYYTNLTDETPDEIALTRGMVTEFNSSVAGSKTLTVTYKTLEAKHDYKIVSEDEIIKLCSSASNFYVNTNSCVTNVNLINENGEEITAKCVVKNNESYKIASQNNETHETWYKKEYSGKISTYEKTSTYEKGSRWLNDDDDANVEDYDTFLKYILDSVNTDAFANKILFYDYKENDCVVTFNCTMHLDSYFTEFSAEFKQGKIVSAHIKYGLGEEFVNISYDSSNEVIPELPNVEWQMVGETGGLIKSLLNDQVYGALYANYIVTETSMTNNVVNKDVTIYVAENEIYQEIDTDANGVLDTRVWNKYDMYGSSMALWKYTASVAGNTKELDSNGLRDNDFLTWLIGFEFDPQTHFTSSMRYSYFQENGIETYKITYTKSEVDYTITYKFENGKIIFAEMITDDGTDIRLYTREFDYETEFTIPGLPEVEWETL